MDGKQQNTLNEYLSCPCHFIMLKVFSFKRSGLHLFYVSSRARCTSRCRQRELVCFNRLSTKLYAIQKSKHSRKKKIHFKNSTTKPVQQPSSIFILSKLHVPLKKMCVAQLSKNNEHLKCQPNNKQYKQNYRKASEKNVS